MTAAPQLVPEAHSEPAPFMSEAIDQLAPALLAVQSTVRKVHNSATAKIETRGGGAFSYSYAPLSAIFDAVGPAMSKAELVLIQPIVEQDDGVRVLVTRLIHASSGQWVESRVRLPDSADMKAFGGAITYMRRYALISLLGIAASDDDESARDEPLDRQPPARKVPRKARAKKPETPADDALGAQDARTSAQPFGESYVPERKRISEKQATRALVKATERAREFQQERVRPVLNTVLRLMDLPPVPLGDSIGRDEITLHLCETVEAGEMYETLCRALDSWEPVTEAPF